MVQSTQALHVPGLVHVDGALALEAFGWCMKHPGQVHPGPHPQVAVDIGVVGLEELMGGHHEATSASTGGGSTTTDDLPGKSGGNMSWSEVISTPRDCS